MKLDTSLDGLYDSIRKKTAFTPPQLFLFLYTPPPHHFLKTLMQIADIAMDIAGVVAIVGIVLLLSLPQASKPLEYVMWWLTNWL